MRMKFKWCVGAALVASVSARAQTAAYPSQPVRIISDSAAGSTPDVSLRLLAEELGKTWGQQVVVVNQPGAGGALAARAAAAAAPDGYTLFMPASSMFLQIKGTPGVADNLPLELPRDFEPIGFAALLPMFIGVSRANGAATLGELLDRARARPDDVAYATTGRGRFTHLTMEKLQQAANVRMRLVAYAGGPAAELSDVATGRVAAMIEGYSGVASAMQSGGVLRGLAVSTKARLPGFEDLPTIAETVPGFEANGWNVMVAPKGAPADIVNKIAADMNKALAGKELNAKYNALGAFTQPMTPGETAAFARSEQAAWRPILEKVSRENP